MQDDANILAEWTRIALALSRPAGTVTAIVRADRMEDLLAATGGFSAILFPLLPHAGEAPKRVLVQFHKTGPAGRHVAPGLVLHESNGRNTDAAEAVLRHGEALRLA